mgnify:CR=1 FL=1
MQTYKVSITNNFFKIPQKSPIFINIYNFFFIEYESRIIMKLLQIITKFHLSTNTKFLYIIIENLINFHQKI